MTRTKVQWLFALVAAAALVAPVGANAKETKFRHITYLTKSEMKDASFVWERRGLCFFGDEVGTYLADGTLNVGTGKNEAKGTCTFEDGSTYSWKFAQEVEQLARGLQKFTNGRGEYVRGTGRFEGMQGTATFSGRSYTPADGPTKNDAIVDGVAKYTLPTKKTKPLAEK